MRTPSVNSALLVHQESTERRHALVGGSGHPIDELVMLAWTLAGIPTTLAIAMDYHDAAMPSRTPRRREYRPLDPRSLPSPISSVELSAPATLQFPLWAILALLCIAASTLTPFAGEMFYSLIR